MKYDIIIIGGGASGLCTAIMSKKENNSVLVIEHNDRVGKKILSTGNGKCNLTNTFCKVDLFDKNPEGIYPYYPLKNKAFIEEIISRFDAEDTIDFFNHLGILCENKNGYIYPRSEQASSVLDCLRFQCEALGVDFLLNYQPVKIIKKANRFFIDKELSCDKLVLATGGMSAPKTGSDGSGYEIAKSFGHKIIEPVPSLCGIRCSDKFFKELAGVRNDSKLRLFDENNELLMEVSGNLQFNDYGISGIPSFQLSSILGKMFRERKKLKIKIDLLPEIDQISLEEFLSKKKENVLLGVLNKKLDTVLQKELKKKLEQCKEIDYARCLSLLIKNFKVQPVGLCSFSESQVTAGGVCVDEIKPYSCESRLVDNLYFAGEIMDINGICGGYNLQWCWSTAATITSYKNKATHIGQNS